MTRPHLRSLGIERLTVALIGMVAGVLAAPAAAARPTLGQLRFFPAVTPFAPFAPDLGGAATNDRGVVVVGEQILTLAPVTRTPAIRQRAGIRGPWSGDIRLAPAAAEATAPIAALNASGEAIAVFRRAGVFHVARRTRSGAWGRSAAVGSGANWEPNSAWSHTRIALSDAGIATLVLTHTDRGCDIFGEGRCTWIVDTRRTDAAGRWSRVGTPLRLADVRRQPAIAVSRRGDVLVAWVDGADAQLRATRLPGAAAAFEAPAVLGAATTITGAAIGDGGDAIVGWAADDPPSEMSGATRSGLVALRPAAGTWGAPDVVFPPGTFVGNGPVVAIDSDGSAALAWSIFGTGSMQVGASIRPAGASVWGAPTTLATADSSQFQDLTVNRVDMARGRVSVVWTRGSGAANNAGGFSVFEPSAAAWSSWLIDDHAPDAVAVAPSGRVVLANPGLEVRNYDGYPTAPPPALRSPRIRITGRSATVTVRLSVAAAIHLRLWTGSARRTYRFPPMTAGVRSVTIRGLPAGRHTLEIAACNRSLGCRTLPVRSLTIR